MIAVAQAQRFEQPFNVRLLLTAGRCFRPRRKGLLARLVELLQRFRCLPPGFVELPRLGVDQRSHLDVEERRFRVALAERLLRLVHLFARQGRLLFLFQRRDLLSNGGIARIVGKTFEMIEIARQRAPLFDGHVAVQQRVELGHRGFRRGADIVAGSHADEIDRSEHPIEHTAPKIRRALPHQPLGLVGVVVIHD